MTNRLRIIEISDDGVGGLVCGRLFAALGHEVTRLEPEGGSAVRSRPPLNADGESFVSAVLNADKQSLVLPADGAAARRLVATALAAADVAIVDLPRGRAAELGVDAASVRSSYPELVASYVSTCGADGPGAEFGADFPDDSLLADAYGGLATMIGDPDERPLSLGGEQTSYTAGVAAFLGAMLALMRHDHGHGGDLVDVAMADVAAYMDWKSDVTLASEHQAPTRSLSDSGTRLVRASDGWVGVIFQHRHWAAMVELIGDDALAAPEYADQSVWLARSEEWWPVIERWVGQHQAKDVYERAQRLGLPFGWAMSVADLLEDDQIRARGFIRDYPAADEGKVPPTAAPFISPSIPWRFGRSPRLGSIDELAGPAVAEPRQGRDSRERHDAPWMYEGRTSGPLEGVVVLDFGTITAGAATTRLLADFGATVLKIESPERPDLFRWWKGSTAYFPSNNAGKYGVGIDLKSQDGRELLRRLAARSHVLVENFRVGVTSKLGIDPDAIHAANPELVYVSLSSQGQAGPQAQNISYGSTLDLLSGLASVTGYAPDRPLWSSNNVNYPDQLVSMFGAGLIAYCLRTGIRGATVDLSQREVVAWTLGAEIADFRATGHIARASGNRRPGRTPHEVYPCAEPDRWFAVACVSDEQRAALARVIEAPELADRPAEWWAANEDLIDPLIVSWSRGRRRDDCVAALARAGVPAAPVLNAADRAARTRFVERRVSFPTLGAKGFPLRFAGYEPDAPVHTPGLGEHTRAVLADLAGVDEEELDRLEKAGAIHQAPAGAPVT